MWIFHWYNSIDKNGVTPDLFWWNWYQNNNHWAGIKTNHWAKIWRSYLLLILTNFIRFTGLYWFTNRSCYSFLTWDIILFLYNYINTYTFKLNRCVCLYMHKSRKISFESVYLKKRIWLYRLAKIRNLTQLHFKLLCKSQTTLVIDKGRVVEK